MDLVTLLVILAKVVGLTFVVVLPLVPISVYFERRFSAIIQDRVGPNRVGIPLTLLGAKKDFSFFGLVQPMADGLKLFLKEDFTPSHVNKAFYWLAPALTVVPALVTVCVVPFGSDIIVNGIGYKLVIADLDIGPLFVFAISSLSVYGITLAGWSSNSKFPFIGGVRSTAQMISYEIALGLSVVPVLLYYGDLNLSNIVEQQSVNGWLLLPLWGNSAPWNNGGDYTAWIFWIPAMIAFVIFTTSVFAETNRMPFDLPECETELVGGYHTEYSSMKFAMFFMGEYAAMVIGSSLVVTLFLGGWSLGPWFDTWAAGLKIGSVGIGGLLNMSVFMAKVVAFILFFILVRWTVPRFRYDQLMRLGWVIFFEAALINVFLAALVIAAPQFGTLATAAGLALLAIVTGTLVWVLKVSEKKSAPISI
ncbi:MAG: NADH-quinone oxidoreductase subunit H [Verrucomicrobia bacterium]|nr:MAG: NADH-quinone oxidoreductase subunit H [Verrucomicrobiota bacterium]TAE89185.1 MAG: NADH-quinone oxidoreductase subunit H [Verrucomicrobiota bacterium]TAF27939.1 MAG: NADH-quinone oxidoreductase subunit H [Verrucomicrobiota bacterium]TAF42788.1 MAG: NADH-quinone oxidoreductase subunit H [Verrucomicrobiota bacterium]